MGGRWLEHDRTDLAVTRILDGAEAEIAEAGVSAATMAAIASRAGCSRATVYTYFPNRHELRLAVADRAALRIADDVAAGTADIEDPERRLVEAVLASVAAVRSTPSLAAWLTPTEVGYVHELARRSDVIAAVASAFAGALDGDGEPDLLAQWIIRVIVSLLTSPGRDADEERTLVERFVGPLLRPAVDV